MTVQKDLEKKIQSFTINIYKGFKVEINKIFIPVKIALFCWFAGAYTMTVFTPVHLKSKGFTIAHLSVFTATSVLLQCLSNVVSGIIVDKTGRSKPVLLTYLVMFIAISLAFTQMPSVKECKSSKIRFQCHKDDNESRLTVEAPCTLLTDNYGDISCLIDNITNLNTSSYNEECKSLNHISSTLNIGLEKKQPANDSDVCNYDANSQNQTINTSELCKGENCKSFEMNCTSKEFMNCNSRREFWIIIYGIMINFLYFTHTTIYRLFDVIVTSLTYEYNADFGRQRVFSILGSLSGPPLTGLILHKSGFTADFKYSLAFVMSSAFTLLSALALSMVSVKAHVPATKMWKQSLELVKKLDVFLFLLLVIVMGSTFGFQSTYSSWYLQDLGASDLLLGINRGAAALYGLPFLYSSKWFINKFGERNLFVLGLLGHAIYNFSFALLKEPWFALAVQLTVILTYHLFWVAVMHNIEKIAPECLQATVKILAGTLHFSIGKVITTMVGGIVMSALGGRTAYTVMGSVVSVYGIIYGIYVLVLHLRRSRKFTPGAEPKEDVH
ncbi:maltose permease-like isoform X2 [Argiope bruennichi]|uniref:maltose permease-like isoform X2 n=1 Tax=Argiope bruennichi TaxID=94029 RepID=UPI0024941ECB|nr:maltose permease-like isoform X2 [Argiope bruennichi]